MISWCRNRAFSASSSDFPLVMSASVLNTREVVDGLSQREKYAWSVQQLEQICCLIKVNTQPTKLNLSFVKTGTWEDEYEQNGCCRLYSHLTSLGKEACSIACNMPISRTDVPSSQHRGSISVPSDYSMAMIDGIHCGFA